MMVTLVKIVRIVVMTSIIMIMTLMMPVVDGSEDAYNVDDINNSVTYV